MAQTVTLTAKNQGYYVVSADGKDVSNHTAEREAIEKATNLKLANPAAVVQYRHDYVVSVETSVVAPTTGSVTLSWDSVAVADGYKVYMGTASRTYGPATNVGNVLTYEVTGLTPGQTYYFSATAYDATKESGFSNEVSKGL